MSTLQTTEIDQARQYFSDTRERVLEVTKGLTEAQWRFKPAPDRWSIAENLEHLVIVQERILGPVREQLLQAPPPPAGTENAKLDAIVLEKIPDRSVKAKAPAVIEPTGQWSLCAARDRFCENYDRLLKFVETTPDLRQHSLESPPLKIVTSGTYTTMDGYQWALTVSAHDRRHLAQILEVIADPSYPRTAAAEAVVA